MTSEFDRLLERARELLGAGDDTQLARGQRHRQPGAAAAARLGRGLAAQVPGLLGDRRRHRRARGRRDGARARARIAPSACTGAAPCSATSAATARRCARSRRAFRAVTADDHWLLEDLFYEKVMILEALGLPEAAVATCEDGPRAARARRCCAPRSCRRSAPGCGRRSRSCAAARADRGRAAGRPRDPSQFATLARCIAVASPSPPASASPRSPRWSGSARRSPAIRPPPAADRRARPARAGRERRPAPADRRARAARSTCGSRRLSRRDRRDRVYVHGYWTTPTPRGPRTSCPSSSRCRRSTRCSSCPRRRRRSASPVNYPDLDELLRLVEDARGRAARRGADGRGRPQRRVPHARGAGSTSRCSISS